MPCRRSKTKLHMLVLSTDASNLEEKPEIVRKKRQTCTHLITVLISTNTVQLIQPTGYTSPDAEVLEPVREGGTWYRLHQFQGLPHDRHVVCCVHSP